MKRLLQFGVLLAAVAALVLAVDFSALQPQGYVSDFAGVIDQQTEAALERYWFRKWGVGKKETNEGILLLLVIQDRRTRLEVGYGLEPYIPDGYAGSLLRQMRPALRAGRYGEAMAVAAQAIGNRIAEAKGVTIQEAVPRRRPVPARQSVPWGSLVFGLVFLLWLLGMGGRRGARGRGMGGLLTGMLLGNLLGRGMYGGYRGSGGGFGGFDSFDGFGGFGGGDSGGGGASGSW